MGMLFIYLLVFLCVWAYTKSPLLGVGAAAILWSVLGFFQDNHEEKVAERSPYKQPLQQQESIFRH